MGLQLASRNSATWPNLNPLIDPATTSGVQPVGQSGYGLVMSEEFTGSLTVTDSTLGYVTFRAGGPQWATWYPNWPRFTSQSPGGNHTNTNLDGYYATSKVAMSGGALALACDKQTTVTGLDYTAGMIQSLPGFQFRYGYTEARIKVSSNATAGAWPAYWMHNATYDTWPPEIDVWEYYGNAFPINTYYNNTYGGSGTVTDNDQSATPMTDYHVFGAKWSASQVQYYLDGTLTTTISRALTTDMFLILNNGADGTASPTFTSFDVSVDYVRVWQ